MNTPQMVASAYDAALERCLVVEHGAADLVRLRGSDSIDFLNRMSTNDMTGLEAGAMRGTVLTTAIGRTVDVVQVLRRPAETLLLTTTGRGPAVRQWLSRYVFFQDEVAIEASPESFSQWGAYGPEAEGMIAGLTESMPPAPGAFTEIDDALLWATAHPLRGFQLLAGSETVSRLRHLAGGALHGPAGVMAFETLRIEQGYPVAGREIGEDVIPLEVGLWDLVSFRKGCYIGQEIIARMESRSRLARRLVGLSLNQLEDTPQEILLDRQAVGRMTSAAHSPRFGPIGLALLRASTEGSSPGDFVLSPSGTTVTLQPLPFGEMAA
jgi:aminomethyltransferase